MTIPALTTLDMVRGQALDIEVTVPVEVDLSGATVEFGIAKSSSSPYELSWSTSKAGQIITGALESIDSEGLELGRYFFSCWITISGDSTPVARGYLLISSDARNR